jgi:hypothetical protein
MAGGEYTGDWRHAVAGSPTMLDLEQSVSV